MHPYSNLPNHCFWRHAVAEVCRQEVDPVVSTRFKIRKDARIATIGSCFAQHLSGELQRLGFNFYVTEKGEGLSIAEMRRRNFCVYSARYGNVYTPRQMLQLFDEAFGSFKGIDQFWLRPDGRFIDPYRPTVEPDGFSSHEDVLADRAKHLACVRELFEKTEVLVLTLGLTEAWASKIDGAIFPLAPGISGGTFDSSRHSFKNFTFLEVENDLRNLISKVSTINKSIKIIVTVSPVPLAATFENRSVVLSNSYSKSLLRVACEGVVNEFDFVDYFPSYELIAGQPGAAVYIEKDARTVNQRGISHVMRLFSRHFMDTPGEQETPEAADQARDYLADREIICDENEIERVRI